MAKMVINFATFFFISFLFAMFLFSISQMMMVDAIDEQSCLSNGGVFQTLGPCDVDLCEYQCAEVFTIGTKSSCDDPTYKICNCCLRDGEDYQMTEAGKEKKMMVGALDEQSCLSNQGTFKTLGPCLPRGAASVEDCHIRCLKSLGFGSESSCDTPTYKICNCCFGGDENSQMNEGGDEKSE